MGNVYSAQNVVAYFIYELNEQSTFVNARSLQYLLIELTHNWKHYFGNNVFLEEIVRLDEKQYGVKEVFEAYEEFGEQHLILPAKEWHLEYGQFQLVYRPYGIPAFTEEEVIVVNSVIEKYRKRLTQIAS